MITEQPPHLKHVATLPFDLLLITMHASTFRYFPIRMFHKVYSSATPLKCGRIVNDDFVAYLLVNSSVKKIENRSTFGEVMDNIVVPCFFDSQ